MRIRKREPHTEAKKALSDAQDSLARVQSRDSEVKHISRELRLLRERNHFTEQVADIFTGGQRWQKT